MVVAEQVGLELLDLAELAAVVVADLEAQAQARVAELELVE